MQFLAWFEANGFARRDGHFRSGSRIPADTCLARPYIEYAESAQFDPVAGSECLLEALEDLVNRGLSFVARQPGLLDHVMDDVLFNQCSTPID